MVLPAVRRWFSDLKRLSGTYVELCVASRRTVTVQRSSGLGRLEHRSRRRGADEILFFGGLARGGLVERSGLDLVSGL